jgi:hypothetical protein
MFKGRMRIVTYVCEVCEHEWTLDESRESADDRAPRTSSAPRARMKCTMCAAGFGTLSVVTPDNQRRIATYACRSCGHEWNVTLLGERL